MLFYCLIKVVWLSIDPYNLYGHLGRSLERVIGESLYSIMYTEFSIISIAWYSILEQVSINH